jgi:hypothetical protein
MASRLAQAEMSAPVEHEAAGDREPFPTAAEPFPDSSFPALVETPIILSDRMTQTPPNWAGDLPNYQRANFVDERFEQHKLFLQPFLTSSVFPDMSARVINMGGWNPRARTGELDQFGYVSLYYFEIYAPIYTIRQSEALSPGHFRTNLRIPVILGGNQALSFTASANIPVSGTWTATGGASTFVGYSVGSSVVSAQAHVGLGVDQLVGELDTESPRATSIFYDGMIGVHLGRHVDLQAQIDGRKLVGQPGATVRIWPGVRIFPLDMQTLSVGMSALYWIDDFNGATVGDFRTRRAGAIVDIGYLFY